MKQNSLFKFTLIMAATLLAACAAPTAAPTLETATATLTSRPPTETRTPTQTPEPPTPTPTATTVPVDGLLIAQVYARMGPGTNFDEIGLIGHSKIVQLVGQDITGEWYQILYADSPTGLGWIVAQYVQAAGAQELPIIDLQTASGSRAVTAQVILRLNIRAGPGLSYAVYGMVDPPATLILTGKTELGNWIQVEFDESPTGYGWVAVAYIQLTEQADLPILDEFGTPVPVPSAGPTEIPVTPSPTTGPAFWDNDSASAPGARVIFSPLGTRTLTYTSDVSVPQGDPADWLEFTPYGSQGGGTAILHASLACSGNGTLELSLSRDGVDVLGWGSLRCGGQDAVLQLPAGQAYLLHIRPAAGDGLQFVHYSLDIRNLP